MKNILLLIMGLPLFTFGQIELVTNGEFTTSIAGWTTSGNVGYNNFFSNGCAAFSGANTYVNGVISQTISVNTGETLTVNLNYARRGTTGATVAGLFEIIDNVTSTVVSSTTLTTTNTSGDFINTSFTIVAPSNSLLIKFTDQTTNTVSRDFYFNTISITHISTLPVELLNFNALAQNKAVKLSWQTASEVNNDYFTIERSKNGVDWEEISKVDGEGNSSSLLNYSDTDFTPYSGIGYYRLKQTDFNGEFKYSNVKIAKIENEKEYPIVLYTNPLNNIFTIEGNAKELELIMIYNCSGQILKTLTNTSDNEVEKAIIDLSNLSSGIYYIKTKNHTKQVYKN